MLHLHKPILLIQGSPHFRCFQRNERNASASYCLYQQIQRFVSNSSRSTADISASAGRPLASRRILTLVSTSIFISPNAAFLYVKFISLTPYKTPPDFSGTALPDDGRLLPPLHLSLSHNLRSFSGNLPSAKIFPERSHKPAEDLLG